MEFYKKNGKDVFIAELEDVNATPEDVCGNLGIFDASNYREGLPTWLTYDDQYSALCSGEEICVGEVVNFENKQHLITAIVTKFYQEIDEFEREFCTITDNHYCWVSATKKLYDEIKEYKTQKGNEISKEELDSIAAEYIQKMDVAKQKISKQNYIDLPDPMMPEDICRDLGIAIIL